jgi:hypothetical protein
MLRRLPVAWGPAAVGIALASGACGRFGFAPSGMTDAGVGEPPRMHSTLALDRFVPGQPLSDFPLLVVLDDSRAQRSAMRADAADLIFRDSSGTMLAHEIEQVGSPGGPPLLAWVRVPVFDGVDDVIDVSYGGDPLTVQTPAWGPDFVAVWHLNDSSNFITDSIGAHPGTAVGSQPDPACVVGTGRAFDADAGDYILVPTGNMVTLSAITMSGWIRALRHSPSPTGYNAIVARQNGDGNADDFYIGISNADVSTVLLATDAVFDSIDGPAVTYGTWMHIAATWELGVARLYVDGVEVGMQAIPGSVLYTEDRPIFIGGNRNNLTGLVPRDVADDDYTDGPIDEVRIERVARPGAWIAADVASMRDQIISYGSAEPLP